VTTSGPSSWKMANVHASGLTRNRFGDVATNIVTG
jgi:hypothetical protein